MKTGVPPEFKEALILKSALKHKPFARLWKTYQTQKTELQEQTNRESETETETHRNAMYSPPGSQIEDHLLNLKFLAVQAVVSDLCIAPQPFPSHESQNLKT